MGDNPPKIAQGRTCRQSTNFLESSIFDTSDGDKLVQYIRQTRGINHAQRIFNNCAPGEQINRSFPIEIESIQQKANENIPVQPLAKDDNNLQINSQSRIPRLSAKRTTNVRGSIGRRVLLNEFEKTSGDSFKYQKPIASSTPINPACREETQDQYELPKVVEVDCLDDCFEPLTGHTSHREIPDAEIQHCANVSANINQHEETLKSNSQINPEHGVDEANANATLCNTNGGSDKSTCDKSPAGPKRKVLKDVSIAHSLLHSSENKANSPKRKSPLQPSNRIHSHPVGSPNRPAQGNSPSEKSKRFHSVSPLIPSQGNSPLQRTKIIHCYPVASPNHPTLTPSISKNNEVSHVRQAVRQEPCDSNLDPEAIDDCEDLKENNIPTVNSMRYAHVRIKRIPNRVTISRKISINEKLKKMNVQQPDSGASSDSDSSSEDDCGNPKKTKNPAQGKTDHASSRKSNLRISRDRSLNRLSSVPSNEGGRQALQQQIAFPDSENVFENYKESNPKNISAQNSMRSKVKSPNRRLTHVVQKPSKNDVASGGPPTSDSDSDFNEDHRNIKEKKNHKKNAGNTPSRKHRIMSEVICPKASIDTAKKNENRGKISDLIKDRLSQKPVVYIPIIQNFDKNTGITDKKSNKENIASKDCGTQTSTDSQVKNEVYRNDIIEILTSDEEEGPQNEQVVREQVLPQGLQNPDINRNRTHLSHSYDSYPIDLRTRRSNQERKRSLRRIRAISKENQSNIPAAHQVRGSKSLVRPPNQLMDEVVMSPGKNVYQKRSSADCGIYTEDENDFENNANLQISTDDVQGEKADRDSCGVGTGTLRCSLESASSSNAMEYDNGKNIDEHIRTLNTINKVQQRNVQQNTTAGRKSKRISSKVDTLKQDYLNIGQKLKKKIIDTNNTSRRKLYSQGALEDEDSHSLNCSGMSSQETPVVPHSKEETRKTLNFSANSYDVKAANNERLGSIASDWDIDKEVTFTSRAEVVNNNDNVFKKPMKPPLKSSKKKAVERKLHKNNITKETNENVVSKPVIPAEERHQSNKSQSKTVKSNRLKASKNSECNSADFSVEPEDMMDDHSTEKVSISKNNVEKNSNNRVGKDMDERRTTRLSTIAETTKSRENSTVASSDAKQSKSKKKERKIQNKRIIDEVETIKEVSSTIDAGLRRSARERKAPIAYWSCRHHDQGSDIYHEDLNKIITSGNNEKKKRKAKISNESLETATKSPAKEKRFRGRPRKVVKDKRNKKDAEKNRVEDKKNEVLVHNNTHQPTTEKSAANDESHVAYDLFDRLKESFTTEKSMKRKDPRTTEENVMNKFIKISEKPSDKVSKSSVNPLQVVNPLEKITSSDEGISTSEENHQSKPPWCMGSHRTPVKTDSGMQSYSSLTHVCKQDRLLLWLKNLSTPRSLTSNKEVVQILHSNTLKIANVEDLVFQEINGVEYAYYLGEDNNYGYMKFHPQSKKPQAKTKTFELKFLSLVGNVKMEINKTTCTVKNGDLITVPKGVRYSILNATDDPAILFFIRR